MSRSLTLNIPDDIDRTLDDEVRLTGRSREDVAVAWLRQRIAPPESGSIAAILPFFGCWAMSETERRQLEQMIDEERHREDERE